MPVAARRHCCAALRRQPAPRRTEINFGIISTESQHNLKTDLGAVPRRHAKETGLKVNAFFASDYAGVIEAMRFNKVQVAWFGNKSAMEAVDRANGEVFAQIRRRGRRAPATTRT